MERILTINRLLERGIYKAPEMTESVKATFPPLPPSEAAILAMESQADDEWETFCTPYVREKEDHSWFVDIYLKFHEYSPDSGSNGIVIGKRLIIAPGYMMTEDDEFILSNLWGICWLVFNPRVAGSFITELMAAAPELHLIPYGDIGKVFQHAYYASFRSGIREQLFKASFCQIALYMDEVSAYDMLATNIEDALGLPLGLLRKLDNVRGIETVLAHEERCRLAARVYQEEHSVMNNLETLNYYQLEYLEEVMNGERSLDKTALRTLGTLEEGWDEITETDSDEVYRVYLQYLDDVNALGNNSHFPKGVDLEMEQWERFLCLSGLLLDCIHQTLDTKRMEKLSKEWKKKYSYEGDRYRIVVPENLQDFLDESEQQHNCLYSMIESEILEGKSVILFMREKTEPHKSLVTLEIKEDSICQAKRTCNEPLTAEDRKFLTEFAKAKGVHI